MSSSEEPVRADAERNNRRIREAARAAFARDGVGASLDDIAAAAGVGSGTLYRHFPTRDHLILALMRDGLDELVALAGSLAAERDPAAALVAWLRAYAAHAATFRGLAATLVALPDHDHPSVVACEAAHDAGRGLVDAAVAAGALPPPRDPQDVLDLAAATAWIVEQGPRGGDQVDRLLDQVLCGLVTRVGAAAPRRRHRTARGVRR